MPGARSRAELPYPNEQKMAIATSVRNDVLQGKASALPAPHGTFGNVPTFATSCRPLPQQWNWNELKQLSSHQQVAVSVFLTLFLAFGVFLLDLLLLPDVCFEEGAAAGRFIGKLFLGSLGFDEAAGRFMASLFEPLPRRASFRRCTASAELRVCWPPLMLGEHTSESLPAMIHQKQISDKNMIENDK